MREGEPTGTSSGFVVVGAVLRISEELPFGVFLKVVERITNRHNFLCIFVRDIDAELFFKRHNQLDQIERVRAEIVNKGCARLNFGLFDTQLFRDDAKQARSHLR